jgi:hypothetical protein
MHYKPSMVGALLVVIGEYGKRRKTDKLGRVRKAKVRGRTLGKSRAYLKELGRMTKMRKLPFDWATSEQRRTQPAG